jgi:hypothetical protein
LFIDDPAKSMTLWIEEWASQRAGTGEINQPAKKTKPPEQRSAVS